MNLMTNYHNACGLSLPKRKGSRLGFKTAVLMIGLLQVAWVAPSNAAGRVFHDTFEDGTISKWEEDNNHQGVMVLSKAYDGGGAHNGTHFVSTNWDRDLYTGLKLPSFSYNKEFLIRMWWRLDKDVDNVDGGKLLRLGYGSQASNINELTIHNSSNLVETWWVDNYGSPRKNCYSNHNIKDRNWHKIEIYVKDDNTNGVFKIWVDGKDTSGCYPFVGDTSSGGKWYPLYMPSNWSMNVGWEHDSSNHFYIDDVEIFSDVGTGATGSMADASISATGASPMPPSNIQ